MLWRAVSTFLRIVLPTLAPWSWRLVSGVLWSFSWLRQASFYWWKFMSWRKGWAHCSAKPRMISGVSPNEMEWRWELWPLQTEMSKLDSTTKPAPCSFSSGSANTNTDVQFSHTQMANQSVSIAQSLLHRLGSSYTFCATQPDQRSWSQHPSPNTSNL